jgi:uncharacterized membrane protein
MRRSGKWWLAVSSLAIAIVAPLPYLTGSLEDMARDGQEIATNYAGRPTWVQVVFYVHVCFGGLAMLVTPIQLSSRIRRRRPVVHRVAGRVGIAAILLAAVAGAVLSPFGVADEVGFAGFGLLAVAWFTCAAASLATIRRRDFAAHRRWAIRTFALTYAAVTLRLWLGVLMGIQAGLLGVDGDLAFDRAYHVVPFLAWVPNLIVAELLIARVPAVAVRGRERRPAI